MFARPRALTEREIERLIERFARAAAIVQTAGFDGVQLHGAHGYLISQFLSPLANLRSDAWGGDAERRSRFLIETVRAVRKAVGRAYPIAVKLNSADFQRGGFTKQESLHVVERLEAESIDLLEISGGTYECAAMMGQGIEQRPSTRRREAYFLEYAEDVRARSRMPLLLTGGFRTRPAMDRALASGAIDLVGLARPFALEPELGKRLLASPDAGFVNPHLATGIAALDAALETLWHGAQLARMAKGALPTRRLGRLEAVLQYVRGASPFGLRN
jgi:2,4-dienoyl-CoA reductase-like NADH-dependent reductase (Old Yellow Enzyme family)